MKLHNGSILVRQSVLTAAILVAVIASGFAATPIVAQTDRHSSVTGYFGLDEGGMPNGNDLPDGVVVVPEDGSKIDDPRPFVMIEFPETSTVSLNSVLFDGLEVEDRFENVGGNQFIYWPPCPGVGKHSVEVSASDSAGNSFEFEFGFETTQRCDFNLRLAAGWNVVSLPSDPIDPSIDAVFTDPSIEIVLAFEPSVSTAPWSSAVRKDDRWETPRWETLYEGRPILNLGRPLTEIRQNKGYWVHSSSFVYQSVALQEHGTRPAAEQLLAATEGWHLLGVVDIAGNQTQNNYGEPLKNQAGNPVLAGEYLGEYTSAYTWNPTANGFSLLQPDQAVTIGNGIWVFYGIDSYSTDSYANVPPNIFFELTRLTFDESPRNDFQLVLATGWNAVSLPSDPIDPSIEAVFTEPSIHTVIAWNPSKTTAPWAVAVRRGDSGWESPNKFGPLTGIRQNKGYWVGASEPVKQPVVLHRYAALPENAQLTALHNYGLPPENEQLPIATEGWHFVGVVDYAGNQTQDRYGTILITQAVTFVRAREYLGEYAQAFTWDPASGNFEALLPDDWITIGDGVWVYYEEKVAP